MKTKDILKKWRNLILVIVVLLGSMDLSAQTLIRFKDGKEETVIITLQTKDTVKYHFIDEPGIIRTSLMSDIEKLTPVDSLSQFKMSESKKSLRKDKFPPTEVLNFDDINRSLKSATSISAISFALMTAGPCLFIGAATATDVSSSNAFFIAGVTIHLGGFGMMTNVPILTNRAYKQINSWKCPAEDIRFKSQMLKNVKAARTISIIQTCTPVIALVGGALTSRLFNKKKYDRSTIFPIAFSCFYGLGMCLSFPEIILIEKARHDLNSYHQRLSIGGSNKSLGLIYKF